jgi:hypothetical protein
MVRIFSLLVFLSLSVSISPSMVVAEDELQIVCAAVMPCDSNGVLLPEYSDPLGDCFREFTNRCAVKQDQNTSDNEAEMVEYAKLVSSLLAENAQLKDTNRRLKRALRNCRR